MTADINPAQPTGWITSERVQRLSPMARAVHKDILRRFAETGTAPGAGELAGGISEGEPINELLSELHDNDVVRFDEAGQITAAYPFSPAPTPHIVAIEDGPAVYAMCAIDALGMSAMLNRKIDITSSDPVSGERITVSVTPDDNATWHPGTAVVLADQQACCTGDDVPQVPAADACCGLLNFFANEDSAQTWLTKHPEVTGTTLTQTQALNLGTACFANLLVSFELGF